MVVLLFQFRKYAYFDIFKAQGECHGGRVTQKRGESVCVFGGDNIDEPTAAYPNLHYIWVATIIRWFVFCLHSSWHSAGFSDLMECTWDFSARKHFALDRSLTQTGVQRGSI